MIIAGYICAFFMGIILGLMGGGGSILTTPVMVYLMGVREDQAPFYSFFVVGVASWVGSLRYFWKAKINFRMGTLFGIPSLLAVFLVQHFVMPAIPTIILHSGNFILTKGMAIMGLFAILMVAASWTMLRRKSRQSPEGNPGHYSLPLLIFLGFAVGIITGLIGVGGGFMIVPALVILCRISIKEAAGTSLLIIALNSTMGFATAMANNVRVNWEILIPFSIIAIGGIIAGVGFHAKIPITKLRQVFGFFTLFIGIFILFKTFAFTH